MTEEAKKDNEYLLERFATRLKEERNRNKLSQTSLANLMGYSRALVTKVETCTQKPSSDFAIRADQVLGTGSLFTGLLPSSANERTRLLRRYVTIEQTEATQLFQWQSSGVPALVQIPEYAREVLTVSVPPWSPEEIDDFVDSQMSRQNALTRSEDPLNAHFIISEGALRQLVGGIDVMVAQWKRLIEWSMARTVTWQVLPRDAGAHPAMQGSYTILDTASLRAALYVETMAGGEVITEEQSIAHARQRASFLMTNALSPRNSVGYVEKLINEETTWR